MKVRHQLLIGLAGGAALAWGARTWLRSRRRIELAGRVVIVTGGSTGLGLMVARQAASRARNSRSPPGARRPQGRRGRVTIDRSRSPGRATDVSDEGQARNLVARTIERFGRVDILVNNAGTIQVGPAQAMTVDDFRQAMATNFWGELYPTLAVLPDEGAGGRRIANVVSVGGKVAVRTCSRTPPANSP